MPTDECLLAKFAFKALGISSRESAGVKCLCNLELSSGQSNEVPISLRPTGELWLRINGPPGTLMWMSWLGQCHCFWPLLVTPLPQPTPPLLPPSSLIGVRGEVGLKAEAN